MNTSQLMVILGGLAVSQVIAMALPYWMGWKSGQTAAAASLQAEIQRLREKLSATHDLVIALDSTADPVALKADLLRHISSEVRYA